MSAPTFSESDARSIAANAARIAFELPRDMDGGALILNETLTDAAFALHGAESAPGFSWEEQAQDWESVCAALAAHMAALSSCSRADWPAVISKTLRSRSNSLLTRNQFPY